MKLIDTGFAFSDKWKDDPFICDKRYSIWRTSVSKQREINFILGEFDDVNKEALMVLTFRDQIHKRKLADKFDILSEEEKKARVARLFGG